MTHRHLRDFAFFFLVQCVNYGALCWNYRAVTQARYPHIAASDLICAAVTFWLIQFIAKTKSWWAFAGYVLGGLTGSLVSVWISKNYFGV